MSERGGVTRRQFLGYSMAAIVAAAAGGGLYAWQVEPRWIEVVRRPLPVAGLPKSLVGARLVQLADLHVGPRVPDDYILHTFERVAALEPDIVVVTGDLTQYSKNVFSDAERIFPRFPRGRLATLGVLGNHDYGPGWSHPEIAENLAEVFGHAGIDILRNEVAEVSGLQIVGMDDLWAKRFEPRRAFASADLTKPAIVLAHNPDSVDLPGWDGFEGWVLAGHTHGGQFKPPFMAPPRVPVKNRRYIAGEVGLSNGRTLYINRGIGFIEQVRFDCRPEITVFELQRT